MFSYSSLGSQSGWHARRVYTRDSHRASMHHSIIMIMIRKVTGYIFIIVAGISPICRGLHICPRLSTTRVRNAPCPRYSYPLRDTSRYMRADYRILDFAFSSVIYTGVKKCTKTSCLSSRLEQACVWVRSGEEFRRNRSRGSRVFSRTNYLRPRYAMIIGSCVKFISNEFIPTGSLSLEREGIFVIFSAAKINPRASVMHY